MHATSFQAATAAAVRQDLDDRMERGIREFGPSFRGLVYKMGDVWVEYTGSACHVDLIEVARKIAGTGTLRKTSLRGSTAYAVLAAN